MLRHMALVKARSVRRIGVGWLAAAMLSVPIEAAALSLTLAWDPVPNANAGYIVYARAATSGAPTRTFDTGAATVYAVPDLLPGVRYCFAVAAYVPGPVVGQRSGEVCGFADEPPSLQHPGTIRSTVGRPVRLQLSGADPEGRALSYHATGLPAGLTLGETTGLILGVPTAAATHTVVVSVSDGVLSASRSFTWQVAPGDGSPPPDTPPPSETDGPWPSLPPRRIPPPSATASNSSPAARQAVPASRRPLTAASISPAQTPAVTRESPAPAAPSPQAATPPAPEARIGRLLPWGVSLPPSLSISRPAPSTWFATQADTVVFEGEVSADGGLRDIVWTNNGGAPAPAAVHGSSWEARVPLSIGTNVVLIRARDLAGRVATVRLVVERR